MEGSMKENNYKILFEGFRRENYELLVGHTEEIKEAKEADDFALREVFETHVFTKLPLYEVIKNSSVCKAFFDFTNRPPLKNRINRIKNLDEDLKNLHLRTPFYTLQFLEDIQHFRNLNANPKSEAILKIFAAENGSEHEILIKEFLNNYPENRDFFYQAYKEGLFSQQLVEECTNDNIDPDRRAKLITLFVIRLCNQVGLNLLRKNFLTIDQILDFLSNDKTANFEEGQVGNEDLYLGYARLEIILSVGFLNDCQQQTVSIENLMNTPLEDLVVRWPSVVSDPLNFHHNNI